jgi:hypothetical protein
MARRKADDVAAGNEGTPQVAQVTQTDKVPDMEEIKTRLKAYWSGRDENIQSARDLRLMCDEPEVPVGMEKDVVMIPTPYSGVERMVGTLTCDPPTIRVPPASASEASQKASSRLEKATAAILEQLQRQSDEDVVERFVESLIADGHGCMRLLYAPQMWSGFPTRDKDGDEVEGEDDYNKRTDMWKRGKPLPISWTWCDPLTVYPMWSERGLEYVLETDQREIATLDPDRFNLTNKAPELWQLIRTQSSNGPVEFSQLWTRETLTYAVDGKIVHHAKHDYRSVPYVYAMGTTISSRDPDYMGLSMLWPQRYLVPYLNRLLTQKASAVRLWSWPTPVIRTKGLSPNGDDGQPRTISIKPGEPIVLNPDESIEFLTWSGPGPDSDEMLSLLMNLTEKAGISDSMYGINPGGDSGYAINQLISAARMKFKPIIAHAQRSMERLIASLWDIIEYQIGQTLYVYERGKDGGWLDIGPDDLQGYRMVDVELNPLLPTDEYATSSRAINEMSAGLRSIYSAMELLRIEQPDEEMNRIRVEKWMDSPEIGKLLTAEAVKAYGLEQRLKQQVGMAELMALLPKLPPALGQAIQMMMMQAAGGGQGGGPPQGGMPPGMMGGGPPPGSMPPGAQQGGPPVMAAPGIQAAPGAPTPTVNQVIGHQGPITRPAGIATGQAPGVRQVGRER